MYGIREEREERCLLVPLLVGRVFRDGSIKYLRYGSREVGIEDWLRAVLMKIRTATSRCKGES